MDRRTHRPTNRQTDRDAESRKTVKSCTCFPFKHVFPLGLGHFKVSLQSLAVKSTQKQKKSVSLGKILVLATLTACRKLERVEQGRKKDGERGKGGSRRRRRRK